MVWPPPSEEIHKQEVQVGKLEIDEKVARGIENRIIGKRKWQKPVVPDDEPKSILKRSNVEVCIFLEFFCALVYPFFLINLLIFDESTFFCKLIEFEKKGVVNLEKLLKCNACN